jgi:hypothetical protein
LLVATVTFEVRDGENNFERLLKWDVDQAGSLKA